MARGRSTGVATSSKAATFDPLLPYEAWRQFGARVGRYAGAAPWWLGDWLAHGRFKYGRRYKEAIAVTGLDYQTLPNYASVARRFDPSRRRTNLTFQHLADVCALADDEQDRWLDRAAAEGWSRNELRRRIRAGNGGRAAADDSLRLALDPGRAGRWREAARICGCGLEEWTLRVLDAAAEGVLVDADPDPEPPAARTRLRRSG